MMKEDAARSMLSKVVEIIAPRLCNRTYGFKDDDYGILKVSMMIAAIDGKVLEREIATLRRLARRCVGWTEESCAAALKDALHSAGYILLQSGRLKEKALIAEFVEEAKRVLPDSFAKSPKGKIRRAFVMWTAMAMSDLRYSLVERKTLLSLRKALGLEKIVTDEYLRETVRMFVRLTDESTVTEAASMLKTFIAVAED